MKSIWPRTQRSIARLQSRSFRKHSSLTFASKATLVRGHEQLQPSTIQISGLIGGRRGGRAKLHCYAVCRRRDAGALMKKKPLTLSEVCSIASQVADALGEAHAGISIATSTCDISDHSTRASEVMDFGLAKSLPRSLGSEAGLKVHSRILEPYLEPCPTCRPSRSVVKS